MDRQATFDKCVEHLRRQNCKSADGPYSRCLYRGPDGLMCAVGLFILDDEYDNTLEGMVLPPCVCYASDNKRLLDILNRQGLDIPLLKELQNVHDSADISDWEWNFKRLAGQFNLAYTPITTEATHAK